MTRLDQNLKKLEILQKFYVENRSKSDISRELNCSLTTVRKHIKENAIDSSLVQAMLNPCPGPVKEIKENEAPFKFLQISAYEANQGGEPLLKHINFVKLANSIVAEMGITSELDKIRLEAALESFISYRINKRRELFINGVLFDKDILKNGEKMAVMAYKYAEASIKHLNNFNSILKELEIKYKKRSPDFGRIHNLNIQKNEFNLNHVSS
jgi:hypothetical protein